MPGQKTAPKVGWWIVDTWLPATIARIKGYETSHPWHTVASTYGLLDPYRTLALYFLFQEGLREEGLEQLYQKRKQLMPVIHKMQRTGITYSPSRHKKLLTRFETLKEDHQTAAIQATGGKITNLNSQKQVTAVLYRDEGFGLPVVKETKTGNPSADRDTLTELLDHTKERSKPYQFLTNLRDYRKCDKMRDYLTSYAAYAVQQRYRYRDRIYRYGLLHPNFNQTGPATTRWSSYWPNAQNISKQEDYNLRYIFGPRAGREWLSFDYSNIELRIFAYASEDKQLVKAFEDGESMHMVIAKVLRPKEVAKLGEEKFKKTEGYRKTKNGNFSLIYGAGQRKADTTYGVPGAYKKIRKQLPNIDSFMEAKNQEALQYGYITTLGGYRLVVPEGRPHVAVNYFVQGSAGIFITDAIIRVHNYLTSLPEGKADLIMQVHDELDIDTEAPASLEIAKTVQTLMEQSGKDYGVPSPVEGSVISNNWSNEKDLKE